MKLKLRMNAIKSNYSISGRKKLMLSTSITRMLSRRISKTKQKHQ